MVVGAEAETEAEAVAIPLVMLPHLPSDFHEQKERPRGVKGHGDGKYE